MKKFLALILSLVMILSLAACNTQPKMGAGNKVIATSGSEKMYLRDFLYSLGALKAQNESYINQYMGLSPEEFDAYWVEESYVSPGFTMFDDLKENTMGRAQEMATLYKIAKDRGFSHDETEMKELKEQLTASVAGLNSPEKTGERFFYEYYYVTIDEAIEVTKMISAVEQLEASIRDSIVVLDDEVKAFYDNPAHKTAVDDVQEALVAHILVQVPEGTEDPAVKGVFEEKANSILTRAMNGENFGQLAAEFSEDPGSKDNNGEYSVTRSTSFVPEFLDWTFAAEVGDFGLVETSYGFHIMHLINLQGFEEMKESLREAVVQYNFGTAMSDLVAESAMEWTLDADMFANIKYSVYGE